MTGGFERRPPHPGSRTGTRRHHHRHVLATLLCALAMLTAMTTPQPAAAVVPPTPTGVAPATCARFEQTISGVPTVANPFDPDQIDVSVEFTGPAGEVFDVDAFFTVDHTRMLTGGVEQVTPAGPGEWRVRFTPTRPGTWTWQTTVINGGPNGALTVYPASSFNCAADPTSHGFLRRSPDDPRHLRWEDGTPYVAIGENLGWADARGTFAYDEWLDRLAARGATWIRVWMPSWGFGLEWLERDGTGAIVESSLGDYTTRLDRAWQLDHVIAAAEQRGMVVMLSLVNHGAFSTGANSEWADNPYNAANGGPIADPHDFFTDPTARALFERRLRYVVARWGSSRHLIWELWNEVDLTPTTPISDVVTWHAEVADRLRALDPHDHLITTSLDGTQIADFFAAVPRWPALWSLPQIDLVQLHLYAQGLVRPADFTNTAIPMLARLAAYGKPVLLAEGGVDYRGPAETLAADPTFQGLHEMIWSGLFGGGIGTGMSWWWDNVIDPADQYHQLDGIGALVDGVVFDREQFALDGAAATAPGRRLQAWPLRGHTTALVWVRNAANRWFTPDVSVVGGATLTVTGLTDGQWRARWMDPLSGMFTDAETVTAAGGQLLLAVPDFPGEIALRLDAAGPTPVAPVPSTPNALPAVAVAATPRLSG